jgi:hypothetical protein
MGIALLALLVPASALADNLAYVRASSQLRRKATPADFHPINLLDDDPATVWCEGSDSLGEGEEVYIFFKKPQKIDRIVVGPAASTGRLILTLRITDGDNVTRINLGDRYVEQNFSPPMRGDKFVLSIVTVGEPNTGVQLSDNTACLADAMLYFKDRPFGGKLTPSQLRYDKTRDRILGQWSGEPLGAPEKFITFAIDGTWTWQYQPMMNGRSQRLFGEYRFRGNRLLMRKGETGRWADVQFKYEQIPVGDDGGAPKADYEVISISPIIDKVLGGKYNNAEFE